MENSAPHRRSLVIPVKREDMRSRTPGNSKRKKAVANISRTFSLTKQQNKKLHASHGHTPKGGTSRQVQIKRGDTASSIHQLPLIHPKDSNFMNNMSKA